jgi:ketosteroid isomerase-like protein
MLRLHYSFPAGLRVWDEVRVRPKLYFAIASENGFEQDSDWPTDTQTAKRSLHARSLEVGSATQHSCVKEEKMTEAMAFAASVYEAIDSMDEKKLAPFLTENCTFVFGSAAPVFGRAASADASKAFMRLIAGIKHDLEDVWRFDDNIVSRMTVTYARKDGRKMSFPAVTIWRVEGQQIADYRVYVDNTPLFAT